MIPRKTGPGFVFPLSLHQHPDLVERRKHLQLLVDEAAYQKSVRRLEGSVSLNALSYTPCFVSHGVFLLGLE